MTRAEHIKRLEELAARASLSPQIQPAPKPSPLTIKINEGLFDAVNAEYHQRSNLLTPKEIAQSGDITEGKVK